MDDTRRFQLLFGPYRVPRCLVGKRLKCRLRGKVKVTGISNAPLQWPQSMSRRGRGHPYLIVCGDLVRALKRESAQAVAHHWGVSTVTVSRWRRELRIPQNNTGTRRLRQTWSPEVLDDRVRALASKARQTAEVRAKISAGLKGKTPPPHVIEAARRALLGSKHTEEARRKMSKVHRRRGTRRPGSGQPWTPEENALLGTMMDKDVAARIGVGKQAVYERRKELCIPSFREQHGYRACREREYPKFNT